MSRKGSLVYQANRQLKDMFAFGESKHRIKITGGREAVKEGIFSFNTARTYIRECSNYFHWLRIYHPEVCTLIEGRAYIREYLRKIRRRDGSAYSPYTLATKAAALAKLYGIRKYQTPQRRRNQITRSRNYQPGTYEANHPELTAFCDSTGLRRHELETLTGDQLRMMDGQAYIRIRKGQAKGGRPRAVPVIGDQDLVIRLMQEAGGGKVFGRVSKDMDIHAHRAKYAAALYQIRARPLTECKASPFHDGKKWHSSSVYCCRKDKAGIWYDKEAMHYVSLALGHNRISVVAEHYLYNLRTHE